MSALPISAIPAPARPAAPVRQRHLRVVTAADLRRAEQEFEARERALAAANRWAARTNATAARRAANGAVAAPATRVVLTARGRLAVRILLGVAAVVLALAVGALVGSLLAAAPVAGASMTVGAGDTLWSIAAAEVPGVDVRDAVAQIMSLNGLESSTIHAGQVLVLPAH